MDKGISERFESTKLILPDICNTDKLFVFGLNIDFQIKNFECSGLIRQYKTYKESGDFKIQHYTYFVFEDQIIEGDADR